jgi:hypothetical protein
VADNYAKMLYKMVQKKANKKKKGANPVMDRKQYLDMKEKEALGRSKKTSKSKPRNRMK